MHREATRSIENIFNGVSTLALRTSRQRPRGWCVPVPMVCVLFLLLISFFMDESFVLWEWKLSLHSTVEPS